ncbi:MAG: LLM class flavin-dependent oxidoreductase [Salinirussus sp.]
MEYGMLYSTAPPDVLTEKATLAEDLDLDFLGLLDSQSLFHELYSSLTTVAHATDSIRIGSTVTNPVTRHPVVTASAIATVSRVAPGRTFLGLASGDSALHTLGLEPATLADLEATLRLHDDLLAGDHHDWEGTDVRLEWLPEGGVEIPRILAAEGPKTLRLAGRHADGVMIGTGLFPDLIAESIERVHEGAREAGRDPEEIETWIFAKANVADERAAAIDEIKMALAASANHAFRHTLEGKSVPEEYREPIRELRERYVSHEHEQPGETVNQRLPDELGLTDYLADRFAVVGTPEDCRSKLADIEAVDGLDGVLLTALSDDEMGLVSRFGRDVLPAL